MASSNQAAWLHKIHETLQIGPAEVGKPGRGEILVENHATAINPADWKAQDGAFPVKYLPLIMGSDLAGEIAKIGENVLEFSKGQRILGQSVGLVTGKLEHGGFQQFTVVPAIGVCPIPDNISYEGACVLPLAISTAAHGLFGQDKLGLPKPTHDVKELDTTLLVWGGSFSVGSAVIQLAVAAGLRVVATASEKNFEFCKELGASEVFDYNSPGIVGDLTAALEKHSLAGAYDGKSTKWANGLSR